MKRFLALASLYFLVTLSLAQDHAWPKCLLCVSAARILSPGFGVDITTSYATSAVRYHNGTVSSLSKVDASSFGHKIQKLEESTWETNSLQKLMIANPLFDTPVMTDVIESAAQVLIDLKETTRVEYGLQLDPVLLSLLPLKDPSIGYRIMQKAARRAGLRLLLDGLADMWPGAVANAAAGNGIGLCPTFTRRDVCEYENTLMPQSLVFGVEYTNASLTVAMSPFRASRNGYSFSFKRYWDLGFEQAERSPNYWHQVKQALAKLPAEWRHRRITDIVLMGEAVTDEPFLRVLQETLWEVLPSQDETAAAQPPLADWTADPEFAASMGAAEQAKRIMEAPDGCVERLYCGWWRRSIG